MNTDRPLALIGEDSDEKIYISLSQLGFYPIRLPSDKRLAAPIRSHADTLIFSFERYIFCSKEYFEKATEVFNLLSSYGYEIIKSDAYVSDLYPNDIAFNAFVCNGSLYGNTSHIAKEILDFSSRNGLKSVSVKQGYAKCSTLVLSDAAIITADDSIAKKAVENGTKVLKIENSPAAVTISEYDYGFIGGASGVYKNTVYFSGDPSHHPQWKQIRSFIEELNFKIISLCDGQLQDIGGIMFFERLS